MNIFDRLSVKRLDNLPSEPALLGRWLLEPSQETVTQNGSLVKPGDALIPGIDGQWTVIETTGGSPRRGHFATDCLPNEQDLNAIRSLGKVLLNSDKASEGWLGWCETSPFAPNLDQSIAKHPLEDVIEQEFDHLDAVCRRPQTHIRTEVETVLVSRARKLDRNVYTHLASHTEDWLHRKITGVQPRRVLAQVREEQWDLYENRVAVRLVDHLIQWLLERIREVRRVRDDIFTPLEQCHVNTQGVWRRSHRICELWGEAFEYGLGRAQADQRIQDLEVLIHRMLSLMDSVLYRMVPRQAQAPHPLQMTNLLSNHDHYCGVARLWQAWSKNAVKKALSPSELYQDRQQLLSSYNAWCMLLIVRALNQLEIEPIDNDLDNNISPKSIISLKDGYSLEWQEYGIIVISKENKPLIRFVPLIHALVKAKPNSLKGYITDMVQAVSDIQPWTIVLHPKVPDGPSADFISTTEVQPPQLDTMGAIDFIEVSSFSLDSVERISRAIRWVMWVPRFMLYPPQLSSVPDEYKQRLINNLSYNANYYYLTRNISVQEMAEINKVTIDAKNACVEKKKDHERITNERQTVQGNPSRRAELNNERRDLLPVINELESKSNELDNFNESLQIASLVIKDLQTCPICRKQGLISPYQMKNSCFEAKCESCSANWGLRYDSSLNRRVPFILIGTNLPEEYSYQRVDDILGCDVLAVPMVNENGNIKFISPRIVACSACTSLV